MHKKKERPEIVWFTVTIRRATGRPDVGTGRIRAADRPKNFNRFESHTQHLICLMRTKVVASSPICKSSVVHLIMSRDHQNDNAVWLCRFTKKSEAKIGTEQSAFEPTTTRSKVSGLPPRLSRNRRMHAKKIRLNHVGDRHGVLDSRSEKGGLVLLTKLD